MTYTEEHKKLIREILSRYRTTERVLDWEEPMLPFQMPKEIRLLFAEHEEKPQKVKEEKPFSTEMITLAEAFSKLADCMRDLSDTLNVLPQNLAGCIEKSMGNRLHSPEDSVIIQKDQKSGRNLCILDVKKDPTALDETEGLLEDIGKKIEGEGKQIPELVKKAWKGG